MSVSSMIADLTTPAIVRSGDGKVFQFPSDQEAQKFETSVAAAGGDTLRLVPEQPLALRPLYEIESHLAALLASEDTVPSELQEQFKVELAAYSAAAVEKRDRVGQSWVSLKSKIALAKAERLRLEKREALFQRMLDRMAFGITRTIEGLELDAKGNRRKLEGNTCTLALRGCDKRVEVTDEQAVPMKYKRVTVTLPAETWELVCDSLDLDLRDQVLGEVKSAKVEVSTSLAKTDLKADVAIAGLKLAGGSYVVVK